MAEAGILVSVIGGVPLLASLSNLIKCEAAVGLAPDPVRHLGALAVQVSEDAERLWHRLRLSNGEHARLAAMGDAWWRVDPTIGEQGAHALLYRLKPEPYTDRVLLAWSRATAGATDAAWHELATLPARWTAPRFPVRAADLIARGVSKGPRLGAALRAAEEAWIAADFPADKAAIAAIADRAADAVKQAIFPLPLAGEGG